MGRFKLGLQLYSVRDYMEKDMEATLKAVSEMGYECVEFAGYFGKSAEEVRALCDKYNLEIISVHQGLADITEKPEETIKYVKTLGIKYYTIPWVGKETWENEYDKMIADIKKAGKLLKENGIQLLYHNHDFELEVKRGDKFVLDSIYSDVDHDILCPELDMCWVNYAGCDPIEYVKKYGDIEELLHMKDFDCKALKGDPVYGLIGEGGSEPTKEDNGFKFRPVGYGRQDVKAIMKTAEDTKINCVIVEQDGHPERTSLEDAKMSIDYLKSIGY